MQVQIVTGDITLLRVDALVNAANSELRGGGGVDGAIHKAAGPELLSACSQLGGCPTGSAKLTPGYRLAADYVIHAVGPVYTNGHSGEADLLRAAYHSATELVLQKQLSSVAYSAISTGIYGYPVLEASKIAVETVCGRLQETEVEVIFSAFNERVAAALGDSLRAWQRAVER